MSDTLNLMGTSEALRHREKLKFKRDLRKNLTPAECVLWQELRNRKFIGTKWKRQDTIGQFIADFLCKEHRIIVEVDGGIHETQQEYDRLRTEIINVYGYRVIRFKNEEVLGELSTVLQRIAEEIMHTPKICITQVTPSQADGEGAGGMRTVLQKNTKQYLQN